MEKPNFIEVYNNVFDSDFCHKAIECFEEALKNGFAGNRQDYDKAPKTAKEDQFYFVPHFNMNHIDQNIASKFNEIFWGNVYPKYAEKYGILHSCGPHNIYSMKLQKTEPSQGYHIWHCEDMDRSDSNRLLTWTVYLNDDFEAGETEFLYQQYRYKPKMGDVVIFPAAFTHTHRGNPPIGGTKYIITGWIEF